MSPAARMRSVSLPRRAHFCIRRCARWWVRWRWLERASGPPTMSPSPFTGAIAPPARPLPRPTGSISSKSTIRTEIPVEDLAIDRGERDEVGNRRALVDLMHGLPNQAKLQDGAEIPDEAGVRRAAGCGEFGHAAGHLLDGRCHKVDESAGLGQEGIRVRGFPLDVPAHAGACCGGCEALDQRSQ